jgi:hypothetical protein
MVRSLIYVCLCLSSRRARSRQIGRPLRDVFSLYDLVGAARIERRDCETEHVCGLEIDDQLEPGRLLDRQVGRLGSIEDLSDVNADLTPPSA